MTLSRRRAVWIAALAFAAIVGIWAFLYFGADIFPVATLYSSGRGGSLRSFADTRSVAVYARSYCAGRV